MTSREKVILAELQVRQIAAGDCAQLQCPFCGLETIPEIGVLCCDNMACVADAVLDHIDHLSRVEIIDRLAERLDKAQGAILN